MAAILVLLPLAIRAYLIQPFKVPTGAMQPTLWGRRSLPDGSKSMGDYIFADKLSYHFRAPLRGEVVVFRTDNIEHFRAQNRRAYFVKRIVGLPGERIRIEPPYVLVNDRRIDAPPFFEKFQNKQGSYAGYELAQRMTPALLVATNSVIQLGMDEYLMLGDNSPRSFDGRYWGAVKRRDIVGRVAYIYWPRERAGPVNAD